MYMYVYKFNQYILIDILENLIYLLCLIKIGNFVGL